MSHHQDKPKQLVCKIQLIIMLSDQTHSKVNKVFFLLIFRIAKIKRKNERKERKEKKSSHTKTKISQIK
jgi:hypothetical protein